MTVNLNTNVFSLIVDDNGQEHLDLTDEMTELALAMQTVLKKWNEVQCRHTAVLQCREAPAKRLLAMAETLETVCKKALDNVYIPFK